MVWEAMPLQPALLAQFRFANQRGTSVLLQPQFSGLTLLPYKSRPTGAYLVMHMHCRYRLMVRRCMEGNRRFAMGTVDRQHQICPVRASDFFLAS